MADLPFEIGRAELHDALKGAADREGKIPRALDALGPVADRDVVLLEAAGGLRVGQLRDLGARVHPVDDSYPADLPRGAFDAAVGCWGPFRGDDPETERQIDALRPAMRPGGRLLVVHDYGHDDVTGLFRDHDERARLVAWSRRDGWFLRHGFKVRVLHCWWSWASLETARAELSEAFGERGAEIGAAMRRPRLAWKVAVYHQTLLEGAPHRDGAC